MFPFRFYSDFSILAKADLSENRLIKSNGMQVAPAELEGHLVSHPDVQDVCVIGIPDERRGEAPKGEH